MTRRTAIKWLHWISAGLILWFYLVEPEETHADPGGGLSVHAGMGLILGVAALIWFSMFLFKGAAGKPGPKLQKLPRRAHPWLNKSLYYGLPAVVLSGAFAGLAAPFAIYAFDILPLNFATGTRNLHDFAEEVHEIVFDAVMIVIVAHTVFHVWRHFWLKDNALRIMVPKLLHRWL